MHVTVVKTPRVQAGGDSFSLNNLRKKMIKKEAVPA
jgi:hypothetical protein